MNITNEINLEPSQTPIQDTWRKVWEVVWPGVDFYAPSGVSSDYVNTVCPFHLDDKESSGVNINTGHFNCFSDTCDAGGGLSFKHFVKLYYKIENDRVTDKMIACISSQQESVLASNEIVEHHNSLLQNPMAYNNVLALGISQNIVQSLRLGFGKFGETFSLPIMIGELTLGSKYYKNGPVKPGHQKAWSSKGLFNGLITPFNQWKADMSNVTVICAGEKDMLVARSNGLNAITIIGGEGQLPTVGLEYFKHKEIWIAYDNDKAGYEAGKKLAHYLFSKKKISKVRNLTSFHHGMKEKEDVTDFFMTYFREAGEFKTLAEATPYWTTKDSHTFLQEDETMVSLTKAADNKLYAKTLNSFVQVKATAYEPKSITSNFIFSGIDKVSHPDENLFYEFNLEIDSSNMQHILGLIQTPSQTNLYIKNVLFKAALNKAPDYLEMDKKHVKFDGYKLDYTKNLTIFTAYVGVYKDNEIVSTKNKGEDSLSDDIASFSTYTLNRPLQTSQIYRLEYKPVRNEFDNNTIVLMCSDFEDSENSIHSFEVGDTTVGLLQGFKTLSNDQVPAKIEELYHKFRLKRIAHLNFDLWLSNELAFHTPLHFMYKGRRTRGVIYMAIIGDTRVGKSELSQELVSLYSQGKFVNAKLSTVDSIIGGSVTRGKEQMIQAGILPKANKSLVVLEEIHGLGNDYFKKITEVKSSGKVIINRVSGELTLDCTVRLIEIANPKTRDGDSKTIAEFSNGVEIIKNLINAPEDIARNDLYIIVPRAPLLDSTATEFSVEEKDAYRERIKWVWSRTENDVRFEDESYIWQQALELNKLFDCPGLALLGAEAHIKLARLSVALAGLLTSTDNIDHKSIYVTRAHVSYCKEWLQKLYSNDIMRVDEYVNESRQYDEFFESDVFELRKLMSQYEPQIRMLETSSEIHQDTILQTITGDASNKTAFFNKIQTLKFVRVGTGQKAKSLSPSIKFRNAMRYLRANPQVIQANGMGESF